MAALGLVVALAVGCSDGDPDAARPTATDSSTARPPEDTTASPPATTPSSATPTTSVSTIPRVTTPPAAPIEGPDTTEVELLPDEFLVRITGLPDMVVTLPDGWISDDVYWRVRTADGSERMAVQFWNVAALARHPCDWNGNFVDPGDTAEDWARAMAGVPLRNATEPEQTEVGGLDGWRVEWSVPLDADLDGCDDGRFVSWSGWVAGELRYHQAPGQVDRVWLVDVGDQLVVIDGFYLPDTPLERRDELDQIVASLRVPGEE